jgi:hypothetical protein
VAWRTYLAARIERLEDDLRRLPSRARQEVDYANAWRGLRDARVLSSMGQIPADLFPMQAEGWTPSPPPQAPGGGLVGGFARSWSGEVTESAFSCLHRADAAFLTLADEVTFRERARDIQAKLATAGFAASDPRPAMWTATLSRLLAPRAVSVESPAPGAGVPAPAGPPARVAVKAGSAPGAPGAGKQYPPVTVDDRRALRAISEQVDQRLEGTQYGIRRFRDRVYVACLILTVLTLLVLVASIVLPDFFSLCSGSGKSIECPLPGSGVAGRWDLLLLTLVALVGGGLAALPLLNQADTGLSPYTLSTAQALLKLPAAALTGIAGLFALQRGLFDVLKPQTGVALLAYAVAFGLSQQAVTRLIDARATKLLSGESSSPSTPTSTASAPAPPAQH